MDFIIKAPCSECPFRKKSLKGYLGPETVESISPFVHREVPWACHTSIAGKPVMKNGMVDTNKYGHACTGAVICATKSCKSYKPGPLSELQQALKRFPFADLVMDWWEFAKYHGEKHT